RDDLLAAIRVSLAKDAENRSVLADKESIHEKIKLLTPREYEIMTYVIAGMLNKQIAYELDISEETVKIHRGRMTQKLGIVSVADLVRLCETVGIAPAETCRL
ncbi:MAG: DNA-binding response regulator, partial [Candidatus Aminicenantes bacterium]|nr:DNA-binding response regulator [Candidatus Aminicenantes bacterium]